MAPPKSTSCPVRSNDSTPQPQARAVAVLLATARVQICSSKCGGQCGKVVWVHQYMHKHGTWNIYYKITTILDLITIRSTPWGNWAISSLALLHHQGTLLLGLRIWVSWRLNMLNPHRSNVSWMLKHNLKLIKQKHALFWITSKLKDVLCIYIIYIYIYIIYIFIYLSIYRYIHIHMGFVGTQNHSKWVLLNCKTHGLRHAKFEKSPSYHRVF